MLFYDGEKMGNGVFARKDDSFAKEGSAFGTTDIERIAAFRNQGQGQFIFRSGEGVGQASAVQIQRDVMRCTDSVQRSEFVCCIQSAVFCRMGNVYHAGHNHMIPVIILLPSSKIGFYLIGTYFSQCMRQRYFCECSIIFYVVFFPVYAAEVAPCVRPIQWRRLHEH